MPTHVARAFARLGVLLVIVAPASAAALQFPRATPESVGMSSAALARITPAMQALVDSGRAPGIAGVVMRRGKIVYLETVGTMDSARTVPLRPDAVFRIYSMTKPVTSVAIMQLYERGDLALNDPVSKFIPEFANTKVYVGGGAATPTLSAPNRPITIADLLTHTSGLTYGVFGNTPVDSVYRRANVLGTDQTVAQFSAALATLPLLSAPGTRWTYSLSIDVLGRVVEVASGKTFDRYLHDEIFSPLRMTHTWFHAPVGTDASLTWLFQAAGRAPVRPANVLLEASYRPGAKAFMGGQGLLSTVPDYLRFAQALLNGGELDGVRILKRETVTLMMQNHLPPSLTPLDFVPGHGFGYGGAVQVDSGPTFPARPGTFRWSGYASTFFWIDPKSELIGMVWTQVVPTAAPIERLFQSLVYAAL